MAPYTQAGDDVLREEKRQLQRDNAELRALIAALTEALAVVEQEGEQ